MRHAQGPKSYIASASQGLISLTTARPCGAGQVVLTASSAVVPGTLPNGRRFAQTAGSPTPLLSFRMDLWPQSVGKAGTPCQATTPRLACASCWSAICGTCGTRPLRPPASLLHKAALPSVPASRCAKAPLGAGHRFAPCRVKATGIMQSGLRWSRSHSRRRFPVAYAPYTPPSVRPCGCRSAMALVRRYALVPVGGLQPCTLCVPPPAHRGLAAARHWPRAPVCPSAPHGGALSPARRHAA